ncbi:MAG: ABC transporter ATP-binding protein [Chthoniobacterales bacterium]
MKAQLRALLRLMWQHRRYYVGGAVFVFIGMFTTLAYPQAIRITIDEGLRGGHAERINLLAGIMLTLLLTEAFATFMRNYLFNAGAEHASAQLRQDAFEHLLRQEIAFFDDANTGALTSRLWGEIPHVQWLLGERLGDALRYTVLGVGGIALLFYTSRLLSGVVLLALPVLSFVTTVLSRRVRHASIATQNAYAEAGTIAHETISGIRTVRAFGQERAEAERHWTKLRAAIQRARRSISGYAAGNALSLLAGEGSALLALWVGGLLILRGQLSAGALISFMLYAFIVAKGVRSASDFWSEAARTAGTTAWVLELLERQPQLPTSGGQRPSESQGQIILDDVHFAYAGRPDVSALAGVSLQIESGETVALVGRSGSGKSTIVNLLLRFYDPTGGRVLLDGRDIRELDSEWLRSQIGIVMQEPVLFSRTVAENIRYGHADGADGMTMAAELARATEFIERLPQRYDTEIGERGVQISGGQRQRLAIARALVRRPRILILDEATSALDAENEALVQGAMRELHYNPTTLIVAHRLSTVVHVDRVVVIDHGRIIAVGPHTQLLQSSDFYRRLVETQLVTI